MRVKAGWTVNTVVAAAYAHAHGLSCRHIFFTPVEATFSVPVGRVIAFHGTTDPWVETETLARLCREANVPLYRTENANHSLETGDVLSDIRNLQAVMARAEAFMRAGEE